MDWSNAMIFFFRKAPFFKKYQRYGKIYGKIMKCEDFLVKTHWSIDPLNLKEAENQILRRLRLGIDHRRGLLGLGLLDLDMKTLREKTGGFSSKVLQLWGNWPWFMGQLFQSSKTVAFDGRFLTWSNLISNLISDCVLKKGGIDP